MTRTSKGMKTTGQTTATTPSATSTVPASEQAWSPAPASRSEQVPAAPTRSGGLGIGSPIYEELVAELGDPAA